MEDKKNAKSKIWLYAVVLFISAFIVLLLTAYSQIRINQNLSNYKDKVSDTENEKNKYQLSFTSAQEANRKLREQLNKLQSENKNLKDKYNAGEKEKKKQQEDYQKSLEEYNKVLTAQVSFSTEDYVSAAAILTGNIDTSVLNEKGKQLFRQLLLKSSQKAGEKLYEEGKVLYGKSDYSNAIQKFSQALEYSKVLDASSDTVSDKCLYYMAASEGKTGNYSLAVQHMGQLMIRYPKSDFYKKAKRYIDLHSND